MIVNYVVDDGVANGDLLAILALAGANGLGNQSSAVLAQQQNETALGRNDLENKVHSPFQQLVQIKNRTNG